MRYNNFLNTKGKYEDTSSLKDSIAARIIDLSYLSHRNYKLLSPSTLSKLDLVIEEIRRLDNQSQTDEITDQSSFKVISSQDRMVGMLLIYLEDNIQELIDNHLSIDIIPKITKIMLRLIEIYKEESLS